MSYEASQAEKGLHLTPPRARTRVRAPSLSYRRRRTYYLTCLALIVLLILTPLRNLTTPFFATYFFYYPFTTFNAAEIASLTTEFYETLAKMGQIPPETINYPPQKNHTINVRFAKSLGMAPQVIELLQRLPYVEGNGRVWLLDGEFADFRELDDLEQSRDPFHAKPDGWSYYSERGPYMRPWQVALNAVGNYGAVFLLDTWTNRIVLTNQLCGCSQDPRFEQQHRKETWSRNVNAWEHLPSRHAPEVLRDFIDKFRNLEWLPPEYSPYSTPTATVARELYRANGWPDNFNLTNFEAAKIRSATYTQQTWEQEKHVYLVKWLENYIRDLKQKIQQVQIKRLGLGSSDRNRKPPLLNTTTAHMIEIGEASKNGTEKMKAKQRVYKVESDGDLIKQEAKMKVAKEELLAADTRMKDAGLSRDQLLLGLSNGYQQAILAYQKFQRTHNV